MPGVISMNEVKRKNNEEKKEDAVNSDITRLVKNITFDLLKESTAIIVGVANGEMEQAVLDTAIMKVIDAHGYHHGLSREDVIKKTLNYMNGYGELQEYVENEDISDIDGTKYNEWMIRRLGKREPIKINMGSEYEMDKFCKLIAARNKGILNEGDTHCRVADEERRLRINISVRPRNVSGPAISIRHHRAKSYTLNDLVNQKMLNDETAAFTEDIAKSPVNVVYCGRGAVGKTTILRAALNANPLMDRVLIAESEAEIYPDKPYCIEQRISKDNEGKRIVSLKELVRDGVTMTLDTYCIGEMVGEETLDGIKAAHTGHKFIGSTHTLSAHECPYRLLTLSMMGESRISERTVKEMIGSSIDVIYYMDRFKVMEIIQLEGYDGEKDRFKFNTLFRFNTEYIDEFENLVGRFERVNFPTGRLAEKLKRRTEI